MKKMSLIWLLALSFQISVLAQSERPTPISKFASFDGVNIHFYDVGKGSKALIFVHGWTCSADFWKKSMAAFPEYRVIAIDLPGHGKSDKPHVDYTMDYFARSIEATLHHAGVKAAVLVGHSMGTSVIRQFYRLYPKKTLGLVIVDGALRPAPQADVERTITLLCEDYSQSAAKIINDMLTPILDKELTLKIRSVMLATPDYVGLSAAEATADEKIWMSDKINVPVLAIMAQSTGWRPDTETFYGAIAPNLDFRMWQGVSHFLMMERPDAFNEAVKHFVSKNKLL